MKFSGDEKIRKIPSLVEELFSKVLYDEEPLFISDEAAILDLFSGPVDELRSRLLSHYGVQLTDAELKLPLWKLLGDLQHRRIGTNRKNA